MSYWATNDLKKRFSQSRPIPCAPPPYQIRADNAPDASSHHLSPGSFELLRRDHSTNEKFLGLYKYLYSVFKYLFTSSLPTRSSRNTPNEEYPHRAKQPDEHRMAGFYYVRNY